MDKAIEAAIQAHVDYWSENAPSEPGEGKKVEFFAMQAAIAAYQAASGEARDKERLDALQDLFIKGNEFLVRFCTEADIDRRDCDDKDHPHFEAFDWEMAEPVFAKTLRDVIDAAIAAREGVNNGN